MQLRQQTIVLAGHADETGPLYTRLLATDPAGANEGVLLRTAGVYRDLDDGRPAGAILLAGNAIPREQ